MLHCNRSTPGCSWGRMVAIWDNGTAVVQSKHTHGWILTVQNSWARCRCSRHTSTNDWQNVKKNIFGGIIGIGKPWFRRCDGMWKPWRFRWKVLNGEPSQLKPPLLRVLTRHRTHGTIYSFWNLLHLHFSLCLPVQKTSRWNWIFFLIVPQ